MQPSGPDASLLAYGYDEALAEPTRESPLPAITADACGRIARRWRRFPVPEEIAGDPQLAARWKLRGTLAPIPCPDDSGAGSMGWPGNHLTGEDTRRLNLWGRLTGLPTNRLLHLAVGIMSEHLRLHMIELLEQQQETGVPLEQLLDGSSAQSDGDHRGSGPRGSRVHAVLARPQNPADQGGGPAATPAVSGPPRDLPLSELDTLPVEPISLAAEPSASGRSRRRPATADPDDPPSTSRPGRGADGTRSTPAAMTGDQEADRPLAEILEQLRQTRGEMRVLWEAVDELRETLEHAYRNPPEPDEPPRCRAVADLDLAADDLLERLDALPAEIITRLREHLGAPAADSPTVPGPSSAPDAAPPQPTIARSTRRPVTPVRSQPPNGNGQPTRMPAPPPAQKRLF